MRALPSQRERARRARDPRRARGLLRRARFASIDDLNAQARDWCQQIARERRVPDAKDKTIADAFLEERARLVELPDDEFPVEERVVVHVGKTPYVRFDRNDYSVPHTHVRRSLTVLATDERVRIVNPEAPTEVLADHKRSFDRDQRIEQEGHLRALVEEKRRAHQSRGFDRLFAAAPSTRTMMERLADRGANLGAATSGLLQLLDRVGPDLLERAVAEVVELCGAPHEIDEVGYLSYDARHADLLFEVVTRRYEKNRSILLTTNKPFAEWPTTFPNAACVVTHVDRLMDKSEIVTIDGDSYRLREAEERQRERAASRKRKKEAPASS